MFYLIKKQEIKLPSEILTTSAPSFLKSSVYQKDFKTSGSHLKFSYIVV